MTTIRAVVLILIGALVEQQLTAIGLDGTCKRQ